MNLKLKKAFSVLLAVVLLLSAAPLSGLVGLDLPSMFDFRAEAASYSGTCGDNVNWSLDTSTGVLNITGTGAMTNWDYYTYAPWYSYRSSIKTVNIADGVTSVGQFAFYGYSSLTGVTIPESITSIGYRSFCSCEKITSIYIPDSVKSIGEEAFFGCIGLTTLSVGGVETMGYGAFYSCYNIIDLTIRDGVKTIGESAFASCLSIESVSIPDSVERIGSYAFKNCTVLKKVNIGAGVSSIGEEVFRFCDNLTGINVDKDNQLFCNDDYGVLFTKDKTELVFYPDGNKNISYIIPKGVKSIRNRAFYYCKNLTSISIADSVTTIGDDAFCGCSGLESIIIPDSVTSIGASAFNDCENLENATISNNLTSLNTTMFRNCKSLTNVIIPDGVTTIGDWAFYGCSSLTSIKIPETVTEIGEKSFSYCSALDDITIGNNIQCIGQETFIGTAYYNENTSWEDGVLYINNYLIAANDDAVDCIVKEGTTIIADYAFSKCKNLKSIEFPDSVIYIGEYAASHCYSVKSIEIGDGDTTIGRSAFYNCSNLSGVKIGNGTVNIGAQAFYYCKSLYSITIGNGCVSIGRSAFENSYLNTVYYVGTQEQWNSISIDSNNTQLTRSTKHFCQKVEAVDATCETSGYTEGLYCVGCAKYHVGHVKIPATGHNYSVEETPATCSTDGKKVYTCHCGYTYTQDIPATGHNYQVDETPVTCTTAGEKVYTCHCGDTYTETFPALGHNLEYFIVEPTCNEVGYECYKCTNCGTEYMREELAVKGHISGDWEILTSVTCFEDGVKIRKCTMCGIETHRQAIPSTGHSGEYYKVESTCKANGYEYYKCTVCGVEYDRMELELAEHISGEWEVVEVATCTQNGERARKCTMCGDVQVTEIIPAIGHSDSQDVIVEPTCVKSGLIRHKCTVCNDTYDETVSATGEHKIKTIRKEPTCTSIGTEQYLCEVCENMIGDMVILPKLDHVYDSWKIIAPTVTEAGSKEHTCSSCNKTETVTIPATGFESVNGSAVDYANNVIYGLTAGIDSLDIYTNIVADGYEWSYIEGENGFGTGTKATLKNGDEIIGEYTIVIFGDVQGDSWYDGEDAFLVNLIVKGMLKQHDLPEYMWIAADCNHDGVIDETDVDILTGAGLKLNSVDQNKAVSDLLSNSDYIEYAILIDQSVGMSVEPDVDNSQQGTTDTNTTPEQPTDEINIEAIFTFIFDLIKKLFNLIFSFVIK